MDHEYADHIWRIECFKAAVSEQLELNGKLENTGDLFVRASELYEKGKLEFIGTKVSTPAQQNVEVEIDDDGMKNCPNCNEKLPSGWKKHTFKKDGSKCGQTFKVDLTKNNIPEKDGGNKK